MTYDEAIKAFKPIVDHEAYTDNFREACKMAIESIEKQIPKKVEEKRWITTECECGYNFSKHHGDGYHSIPYERKTRYCPKCGQRLDWSEDDDR